MEPNTTLILEGGAMRGLFTSGVLDVFMENDLYFPRVAGVSAGALNGVNYVAHQPGRSRAVNLDYVNDPRYMGASHLLKNFSYFNFDFLLGEVSETLNPLDFNTLYTSPQELWAVATDCRTGRAVYFEKNQPGLDFMDAVRASASLPLMGRMVKVGRDVCLDGGVANAVPLPADLPVPCGKTVLVLTRQMLLDGNLSMIDRATYPAKRFPGLLDKIGDDTSTYEVMRKDYGVQMHKARREVTLVYATNEQSKLLGCAPGAPLFKKFKVVYDEQNIPVHISSTYISAENVVLTVEQDSFLH